MLRPSLSLLVMAILYGYCSAATFHVCGNYCGPGWCDADYIGEAVCDDSVAPETWPFTGASCADVCCRAHDKCCGHGVRSTCNPAIVACLSNCDPVSVTCTLDGVPVPPTAISTAMSFITNLGYCCGSPCATSQEFAEAQERFNATVSLLMTMTRSTLHSTQQRANAQHWLNQLTDYQKAGFKTAMPQSYWRPQVQPSSQSTSVKLNDIIEPAQVKVPVISPLPEVNYIGAVVRVTKSEFANAECRAANEPAIFVYQNDPAVCSLVNVSSASLVRSGRNRKVRQQQLMRRRIACSMQGQPMVVFYDIADTQCKTPVDYDSTMFPKECVDNAQYACIPEPAFDDYVFRSALYLYTDDCTGTPDTHVFLSTHLSKCVPFSSDYLNGSMNIVNIDHEIAQMRWYISENCSGEPLTSLVMNLTLDKCAPLPENFPFQAQSAFSQVYVPPEPTPEPNVDHWQSIVVIVGAVAGLLTAFVSLMYLKRRCDQRKEQAKHEALYGSTSSSSNISVQVVSNPYTKYAPLE